MSPKRTAKSLTVTESRYLTPNMLRLTLRGESVSDFPDDSEGSYFKLVFDGKDAERPIMRTYTISKWRQDLQEIDVDFMLHGTSGSQTDGVAAPWARQANVGDTVSIFGPGPATFINTEADWFLLAADMTALPALSANLPLLPQHAKGNLVLEILSDEDRQELPVPENMSVIWVINPHAGSETSPLYETIKSVEWLDGQVAIWTACEFTTMKKIRQYYREQHSVQKSHLYISSYWKQGLKEEQHKVVKREDSD